MAILANRFISCSNRNPASEDIAKLSLELISNINERFDYRIDQNGEASLYRRMFAGIMKKRLLSEL
jgi:hypothetical protein